MPRKKHDYTLATFDTETDPFRYGRTPEPFAVGFYAPDEGYKEFWGSQCIVEFSAWLDSRNDKRFILFAHNGGKFDFFYMLSQLRDPVRIINGRIVSAHLGVHRVRDSYAILPLPLRATGEKSSIDFTRLERENRQAHRAEISAYLKQDCVALYNIVAKFREQFGDKLTIGGTAIKELERFHPVERQGEPHDEIFRPYYFGGRVECFEQGILRGPFKVYDVNSMYPYVMAEFAHPLGSEYEFTKDLNTALRGKAPFFAEIDATSRGAFPVRGAPADPLDYPHATARFFVTGHELRTALALRIVDVHHCAGCYVPVRFQSFREFVQHWYSEKLQAEKTHGRESTQYLFAKLILNSAYGKFGSNPANYFDYRIWHPGAEEFPAPRGEGAAEEPWEVHADYGDIVVLRLPAKNRFMAYYDVATAASITGAARAVLMHAIHNARRPIYCDTDSIICEHLGLNLSRDLGAWKLEGAGNQIAVGGKKLYALRNNAEEIKQAAKGVTLTPNDIFDIARGNTVISQKAAPTFSLTRPKGAFVQRAVSMKGSK